MKLLPKARDPSSDCIIYGNNDHQHKIVNETNEEWVFQNSFFTKESVAKITRNANTHPGIFIKHVAIQKISIFGFISQRLQSTYYCLFLVKHLQSIKKGTWHISKNRYSQVCNIFSNQVAQTSSLVHIGHMVATSGSKVALTHQMDGGQVASIL